MNPMSFRLILVVTIFIACSSKNRDTQKAISSQHVSTPGEQQQVEDTLYKTLIFDTTKVFNSTKELNGYKKQLDEKFRKLNLPGSAMSSFTIDSLKKLNEDLYTLVAFRRVRKTNQDIFLLLYNIDFSNLVTIQDRLDAYKALPEPIKNSTEGKKILERLTIKYNSTRKNIGLELAGLSSYQLLDSSKKSYLLSDLLSGNQQYTLLIFSASWCVPCRYEGLYLKRQFPAMDPAKLKMITVSVDTEVPKWKKAIITDACPWMQLWMPGDFEAGLTKALGITKIPANVLFNKERKIIAQNSNVDDIFREFPGLFRK